MTGTKRVFTVLVLAFSALGWAVVPAFATPKAEDKAEDQRVYSRGVAPVDGATGGDSTAESDADAESEASAESETSATADSSSGDANGGDASASNTAESGSIHTIVVAPIHCVAVFAEAHCSVTINQNTGDVKADQDAVAKGGDGGNTGDTGHSKADADSQTVADSDDASARSGHARADEGGDAADSDADDSSLSSSDA